MGGPIERSQVIIDRRRAWSALIVQIWFLVTTVETWTSIYRTAAKKSSQDRRRVAPALDLPEEPEPEKLWRATTLGDGVRTLDWPLARHEPGGSHGTCGA